MTWIGIWTLRGLVVFLGIFAAMLATNLLGLNKAANPFSSWPGFIQAACLSLTVCALLAIEALIEKTHWPISKPTVTFGTDDPPPTLPMN